MKVFTCTEFAGHNPVGTAAVIVSESRQGALQSLRAELRRAGLVVSADNIKIASLVELDLNKPKTTILCDGEY